MNWGGQEVQEGGNICMLTSDSLSVQQKLTEHCKAIIFQKKNQKKKEFHIVVLEHLQTLTPWV